ncbi:MAG TPA: NAD(P)/FAD-dependent oxidoreductase [Kofleriaceae bacterium]|jgi:thioredoxin reductase
MPDIRDVIIIGGSYAGISAGLMLARGKSCVLVIDAGERRNRFAASAHGLVAHDGDDPAAIWHRGKAQLLAYPTVQWREDRVLRAAAVGDHFEIAVEGEMIASTCIVLTTGVVDELPAITGLAERWGRSVFHCPYCHGYELGDGPIGVIATSPMSVHQALMLPQWAPTTYFTRGMFEPTADELAQLERRDVAIVRTPIDAIEGHARVANLDFAGVFVASTPKISPLASQLGLELDATPMGSFVKTDPMMKATSVRGVFAAGDTAMGANIAMAIGDGARAGAGAHRLLMFG